MLIEKTNYRIVKIKRCLSKYLVEAFPKDTYLVLSIICPQKALTNNFYFHFCIQKSS